METIWTIKDSNNQVIFSSESFNEVMGYFQEILFDIDSFGKYPDDSDENIYIDFNVVSF